MPFVLRAGLYLVSLIGIVSSVAIPLTMKRGTKDVIEATMNNSDNLGGGQQFQVNDEHIGVVNQSKWNEQDLSFLVKIILYLLKSEIPPNTNKTVQIQQKTGIQEWSWMNFDKDWTEERVKSNEVVDSDFEHKMKESLRYVLRQWKENRWNSVWHGDYWGTSWNDSSLSKNVMMTGVDPYNKKNVLLKTQLKDKYSYYIVGLYEASLGKLTLGLSKCLGEYSAPQCQIAKQVELQDKRIQIVFS